MMKKTLPYRGHDDAESNPLGLSDTGTIIISRDKYLPGDRHQRELFVRLHEYLTKNNNFKRMKIDAGILVTALFTNRTYLFNAVKAVTGKTLQQYINYIRQEEARYLLEISDERIETIATACGYSSVRTFYRLFRHNYGMSPAEYRKRVKKHRDYVENGFRVTDA